MLSVPKLDDLSFEKLFERARSQIPMYTDDWTDLNHHDPGITVLQTFAWLVDTLNYYIDATGEAHRLAYLNLLGLRSGQAAARCNLAVSAKDESISLGQGAKLLAGDTVFELTESYSGNSNRMTALFCEVDGALLNLTPLAGVDGEFAGLFTYDRERESVLYIGFERELSQTARLYVDVWEHPERIPFTDDFTLSQLAWEYYDGGRWQSARLLKDETCGFLRSGFVSLALPGETKPLPGHSVLPKGHYLRAKLLRNEYDVLPKIGSIYPNCVEAVQTGTGAQALEYVFDGSPRLPIGYHVGEKDVVCVAVEEADGYSLWFEHVPDEDSLCEVIVGELPWQRVVCFDKKRFGAFPEPGQKILVTVTSSELFDKLQLGVTSGFACQRLEIDIENLYALRLALMEERDGRIFFRLWDSCDNIAAAACGERVFQYDRSTGEVLFGDGISGMQPEAGQLVMAVTAKTSLLDEGNVRQRQVSRFLDGIYAGVSVSNPAPAQGGKRPKTSYELEREIEEKIYRTTRAVTEQDYINLVRRTPGLIIDGVNVISGKDYAAYYGEKQHPNTVLIAVKPYCGHERCPALGDAYRRRLREHIEAHRLLVTEVRILPARYLRIEAGGRIVLTEDTPAARNRVEEKLRELIDFERKGKFGTDIVCGRIFSHLEMLDCVVRVTGLTLSCIGEGGRKNEQGDIAVYPDTLALLHHIDIEYVPKEG